MRRLHNLGETGATSAEMRAIRGSLGLSAIGMAQVLGVTRQSIYSWEAGRVPTPPLALRLARVIGQVPRDALLNMAATLDVPMRPVEGEAYIVLVGKAPDGTVCAWERPLGGTCDGEVWLLVMPMEQTQPIYKTSACEAHFTCVYGGLLHEVRKRRRRVWERAKRKQWREARKHGKR